MIRSGSARKVLLVSCENEWRHQIETELKFSGIPVQTVSPGRSWSTILQKSNHLILIDPPYEEFFTLADAICKEQANRTIFIYTSDERWKQKSDSRSVFYLPSNTHPLELARLLVEKLNLPAVSNKPVYAFSFFQF
jgi:hypothetical protein